MKENLVQRNVSEATRLPKLEYRKKCPLTTEQLKVFLSVVRKERLYPAFLLEIATGLRRGELLALRWSTVDFKKGLIMIRQTLTRSRVDGGKTKTALIFQDPKTKASRRDIPLPNGVLEELKAHKARQAQEKLLIGEAYQDNDLVFCTPDGKPLDPRNILRLHTALLKNAKLPHISFHDLRHQFATLLLDEGIHPKVVQEMLGHTKISTTLDIYSHVSTELKEKAANRLDEVLNFKSDKKEAR